MVSNCCDRGRAGPGPGPPSLLAPAQPWSGRISEQGGPGSSSCWMARCDLLPVTGELGAGLMPDQPLSTLAPCSEPALMGQAFPE